MPFSCEPGITGPLVLRGPQGGSAGLPFTHRSEYNQSFRKGTKSASRCFTPSMSTSSFFTRHNPHPFRVRHIKGLLDVPICHVSDEGFVASTRMSLQTPERRAIQSQRLLAGGYPVYPSNSYGVDTYDLWAKKGIPHYQVPTLPRWYDELKELSRRAGVLDRPSQSRDNHKQQGPQYSKTTGRMNETPLRPVTSRGQVQSAGHAPAHMPPAGAVTAAIGRESDYDGLILELLSTILQTDSISAIQQWLTTASDREKAVVSDMMHSALAQDAPAEMEKAYWEDSTEFRQKDNCIEPEVETLVVNHKDHPQDGAPVHPVSKEQVTKLPDINQTARSGSRLMSQADVKRTARRMMDAINEDEEFRLEDSSPGRRVTPQHRPASKPLSRRSSFDLGAATKRAMKEITEDAQKTH